MLSWLSKQILHLLGWKLEGKYPYHLSKFVLIVIPHTSNWDFPLGLLVRKALRSDIKFLAKKSLFRFPFGSLFQWLGGYPVDRSRSQNFVDAVVEMIEKKKEMIVCIAPEGTRSKVEKLKSGFYYIARGAQIPILMVKFDYKEKVIGFAEPFLPPSTYEETLEKLMAYYKGVEGKFPEQIWAAIQ
jgi:1-acyl-sn-glycerol-3-phosphate acyltransferase